MSRVVLPSIVVPPPATVTAEPPIKKQKILMATCAGHEHSRVEGMAMPYREGFGSCVTPLSLAGTEGGANNNNNNNNRNNNNSSTTPTDSTAAPPSFTFPSATENGATATPRTAHGGNSNENTYYAKLLVPPEAASLIIGKSGSSFAKFRSDHGVVVRISGGNDPFPSTGDAVVHLKGSQSAVFSAVGSLLNTITKVTSVEPLRIRLLIPKTAVGLVLGKQGVVVQEIRKKSGSVVFIREAAPHQLPAAKERICEVWGTLEQTTKAVESIFTLIQNDKSIHEYQNVSYSDSRGGFHPLGGDPLGGGVPPAYPTPSLFPYSNSSLPPTMPYENRVDPNIARVEVLKNLLNRQEICSHQTSIIGKIPADKAGLVIGSEGRRARDILNATGARIHVLPESTTVNKGDNETSTAGMRLVEITGSLESIYAAYAMCMDTVLEYEAKGATNARMRSRNNLDPCPPDSGKYPTGGLGGGPRMLPNDPCFDPFVNPKDPHRYMPQPEDRSYFREPIQQWGGGAPTPRDAFSRHPKGLFFQK